MIENIKRIVRSLIAILLVCASIYLAVMDKLDAQNIFTLASMAVAFYFGEKAARNGGTP